MLACRETDKQNDSKIVSVDSDLGLRPARLVGVRVQWVHLENRSSENRCQSTCNRVNTFKINRIQPMSDYVSMLIGAILINHQGYHG